jgi:cobalt-zinc-cadmium efflux system outer membrane protein
MYRTSTAISLLLLAAPSAAQPPGLTEATALRLGLARETVQQRGAGQVAEAHSDVLAAGVLPNPEFDYQRETLNNEEDRVEQTFVVSQQVDVSGRRALRKQAADHHLEAARQASDAWRAKLGKDIRERFYQALLAQQRRQVYTSTRERIGALDNALRQRRREGDVSLYDYRRVTTERAAIEAEADNAGADFESAWQYLWAALGDDNREFQTLQGELPPGPSADLAQLAAALEQRPDLRQLREQSEAYRLQQRAASKTFPSITLGLGLKREETNDRTDNGLVLNASLPLPVFDTGKDRQARYRAQALVADSEYRLACDTARAELKGQWQRLSRYRQSAARFRQTAVKGGHELIEVAEAYYRAGEIGILELLDAYRGALDAELSALELEYKARSAAIELDYLSGGSLQ